MTAETAVASLIETGYLKYVPAAQIGTIRGQLVEAIRHGFCMSDWGDDHSKDRRTYFADSESLMEGGIGEVILKMRSVLETEGVRVDSVGDDLDGEVYVVNVNGRKYPIYDEVSYRSGLLRGLSTKGLLDIVNGLLGDAGSDERLYWIGGGDEGRVILLTEAMYELLASPGLGMDEREMPRPADAIDGQGFTAWYRMKDDSNPEGGLRRHHP
jgi:hypothetical protein